MNAAQVLAILLSLSTLSQCQPSCQPNPSAFAASSRMRADEQTAVEDFMNAWFDMEDFPAANLTRRQREWFDSLGISPAGNSSDTADSEMDPEVADASDDPDRPATRKKRQAACYLTPQALSRQVPPPRQQRVRKEIRQISGFQRKNFIKAITKLTNFIPDPMDPTTSGYDVFVKLHRPADAPSAHGGAGFLPWHREYLLRFENALIDQGYRYGLPYFDSTLDQTLPTPSDAALWTPILIGEATGVVGDPFPNWSIIPGVCSNNIGATLTRDITQGPAGKNLLYTDANIVNYLGLTCFRDLGVGSNFEGRHGAVHVFVGDHMGSVQCSPSDPVFWMHHAFVDCVWEEFRQNSQTSPLEREYPSQLNGDPVGGPEHEWNEDMGPFQGLKNAHGILNWYTDYFYRCMPRPMSCVSGSDCGNRRNLWCDKKACRCRPKVRKGGDCTGLPKKACMCKISEGLPKCTSNVCECIP